MEYWNIVDYTDLILFIFVSLTVLYMGIFALAALISNRQETPKTRKENRFIIFIPAYKNGEAAERTVQSILGQVYPQRQFDVSVIADELSEMSKFRLAQQPITLLDPKFTKHSRAKSLQLAVNNLPRLKIYDIAMVIKPGCVVEPEFLSKVNEAYEAAGTKAIQTHCVSQNHDTAPARLSSIFEEINNSIFRRGHIALGLSAATASSGMAFDFNWFKENIMDTKTLWDDKELEIKLLRQHIYVDYFDDIMIFDEKTRLAEDFNRQRGRWIRSQVGSFMRNIRYLPGAIVNRHYDVIDKIIQWTLLPRIIMMGIIILMGIIMPFIYFTLAIKWWLLFAIVLFIFAMATPNYLVDDKWDKTFFLIPVILLSSVLAKTPVGQKLKKYVNKKL
jgi:hypothetical protein